MILSENVSESTTLLDFFSVDTRKTNTKNNMDKVNQFSARIEEYIDMNVRFSDAVYLALDDMNKEG